MQQVPFVGPYGQVLLIILATVFAYLTWRNRQWRSTAEAAQAALGVSGSELDTWKERGERLSKENRELLTQLAELKARTDLQPLVDAIKTWTVEGRGRFDQAMQRLEAIHGENVMQAAKTAEVMQQVTATLATLSERLMLLSK